METNTNIEDQVNRAFQSVKNTEPVELPFGFSDRVMNKLQAEPSNVRSLYTISPLLKMAAMFILLIVNVFALKLAFGAQPAQSTPQYATIKDFVNQCQVNDNDTNEELLTTTLSPNEQR